MIVCPMRWSVPKYRASSYSQIIAGSLAGRGFWWSRTGQMILKHEPRRRRPEGSRGW